MNNIERRDAQIAYRGDGDIFREMQVCRGILQRLNTVDRTDVEAVAAIVKELLGKSEGLSLIRRFIAIMVPILRSGRTFLQITIVQSWMWLKLK